MSTAAYVEQRISPPPYVEDESYGIGSRAWQLYEHVRYPFDILCPENDNADPDGDYRWFREWLAAEAAHAHR